MALLGKQIISTIVVERACSFANNLGVPEGTTQVVIPQLLYLGFRVQVLGFRV